MTTWHPATKLLMLAALLVVPYLLWTSGEDAPPVVAASVARTGPDDVAGESSAPIAVDPEPFVLPPLEQLTAVVERPLFSPSRRMPVLTAAAEPEAAPTAVPVAGGPAEPDLRFFGTAREDGVVAALVTFPDTKDIARLQPGDPVGDWKVLTVERDRMVLGLGDEQRVYELFGTGALGAPRRPDAPAAESPEPDAAPASEPSDADEPVEGVDEAPADEPDQP